MSCAAFERWLDDGMPEAQADAARSHAAGCTRCAASLAAAEAIEAGLARAAFAAPASFTDSVMARVASLEAASVRPAPARQDALPWWVRTASDPAVAGAAALGGLLIWKWDAIARVGVAATAWLERMSAAPAPAGPAWLSGLGMQIAVVALLVPASLWLARASFHASEKWFEHSAGRRA